MRLQAVFTLSVLLLLTGSSLAEEEPLPVLDLACAQQSLANNGWSPVCVADGRSADMGTIYPNSQAYLQCTAWADDALRPRYYLMLPAKCSARPGCSVMAAQIQACQVAWQAAAQLNLTALPADGSWNCECAMPTEIDPRLPKAEPLSDSVLVEEATAALTNDTSAELAVRATALMATRTSEPETAA